MTHTTTPVSDAQIAMLKRDALYDELQTVMRMHNQTVEERDEAHLRAVRAEDSLAVVERELEIVKSQRDAQRDVYKALQKMRGVCLGVCDEIEDEGDRVYFGSTMDADRLKEAAQTLDDYSWHRIIEPDVGNVFDDVRAANARAHKAETRLAAVERERDALKAKVETLESLVYVPGLKKCQKCGFQLLSQTLYLGDGTVGANERPEQCPNCDVPMWRVTERAAGNEMVDRAEKEIERTNSMERERDALREAMKPFGDLAGAYARIYHTEKDDSSMFRIREASLTAGMLRRAARVLSEGGKDD